MTYTEERDTKYLLKLQNDIIPLLPEFCKDFFVGIAMRTTALTRYNYGTDLKLFFNYLVAEDSPFDGMTPTMLTATDMASITKRDVERFLSYIDNYYSPVKNDYMKNRARAKARKFSAVRALFTYLYNSDIISSNVTAKVSMPKIRENEIIRLEDDEVSDVLYELGQENTFNSQHRDNYNNNNTKIRDNAIITLLLSTGIRVSECVGLDVDDLDLQSSSFTVIRKGEKRDILYLSDDARNAIMQYLAFRDKQIAKIKDEKTRKDTKALFLSLRLSRISVRAVELTVKKYASVVSPLKNISPHKLRSTYGTALYRATKDIYVVAEVLGHKDINTTKRHYAAIGEDIKKSAANKVDYNKDIQNGDSFDENPDN